MRKKLFATIAIFASVAFSTVAFSAERVDEYRKIADDLDIIQVYDAEDLTIDILENRNEDGKIIIEKVIGQVLDSKGNGKVLNTDDEYFNYISYKYVKGARVGDVILSYFIYNPDTNGEDDILDRFDYIIDRIQ